MKQLTCCDLNNINGGSRLGEIIGGSLKVIGGVATIVETGGIGIIGGGIVILDGIADIVG